MSENENLNDLPEGGGGDPAASEGDPVSWGGPSEEEWRTVVGAMSYMAEQLVDKNNPEATPELKPEELENMDAGELVQLYVDGRLSEIQPYVESAAREAGEKRMNELFDTFEQEPEIGKFDRKYAARLAESLFNEIGDPVEAVRQAAFMTANFSKSERKSALDEYKAAAKRTTMNDPGITGSGERSAPPAKTYDEVIDRWSGQQDV